MTNLTSSASLVHALVGPLKHMGATMVAQAWLDREPTLRDEASTKWLVLAVDLALSDVRTETDLLMLAERAPSDLLFGLAYGKLTDAMAMRGQPMLTPAHHVRFALGERSQMLEHLYDLVLARGHELELKAESANSEFFDDLVPGQSRADMVQLIEQAGDAPDDFTLGQMTSWVLTAHRLANPHLYTQALSRLSLTDVGTETLTEYCEPRGLSMATRRIPAVTRSFTSSMQ